MLGIPMARFVQHREIALLGPGRQPSRRPYSVHVPNYAGDLREVEQTDDLRH